MKWRHVLREADRLRHTVPVKGTTRRVRRVQGIGKRGTTNILIGRYAPDDGSCNGVEISRGIADSLDMVRSEAKRLTEGRPTAQ